MRNILLVLLLLPVLAQSDWRGEAASPAHRLALLELYTSEGCSSCPPAERFLSRIKDAADYQGKLVALAYHVTYWDYIGWKDPFGDSRYDQRQRDSARKTGQRIVYTPQFVLNGRDYRRYSKLDDDIRAITAQASPVDLLLRVEKNSAGELMLTLEATATATAAATASEAVHLQYFFAVSENNLGSQVTAGENEGEWLGHDFVVRKLVGPFTPKPLPGKQGFTTKISPPESWRLNNASVVAFAQNTQTGEVVQSVRLGLK